MQSVARAHIDQAHCGGKGHEGELLSRIVVQKRFRVFGPPAKFLLGYNSCRFWRAYALPGQSLDTFGLAQFRRPLTPHLDTSLGQQAVVSDFSLNRRIDFRDGQHIVG